MFEGFSNPLAVKLCAAAVVVVCAVTAVAVAISSDGNEASVAVDTTSSAVEAPVGIGFVDDVNATDPSEHDKAEVVDTGSPGDDSFSEPANTDDKTQSASDEATLEAEKDEEHAKDDQKSSEEADHAVQVDVAILSPEDGSHHENANVVFEGEASVGARVFAGPYEATVDGEGHWYIELVLSSGANTTIIKAEDSDGNIAEDSITAWLDAEEKPTDDKEHSANVEFSAAQKYGSCEEVVPYDVFWGTATPKTDVQISSPYGSAAVEVDKSGHWEKKVIFETAPRGQPFAVSVNGDNGSKTFEFLANIIEEESNDK